MYDSLIGVDLMKKLGMRIDFSAEKVYTGSCAKSVNHELEGELLDVSADEQGPLLTYSDNNSNAPTVDNAETTWNVVTCEHGWLQGEEGRAFKMIIARRLAPPSLELL